MFYKKRNSIKILHVFSNVLTRSFRRILKSIESQLHTPIWVKWNEKVQNLASEQYSHERNIPFEIRFDLFRK